MGTMRPIEQQTILITGATDGLGRALAAELAAEGATVLVHGRDDQRGKATLQEIGGRASWYRADLASLAETRALAEAVRADHPRLDVLVNNAGIGNDGPRMESADGHELTFQVNYLSGYLLTRLLLPTLVVSAPARIVNVSSLGQEAIDFDDVMITRGYSGMRAYRQSKLAQILFTVDLAGELAGTGVTANALHPATYMPTKLVPTPISTLEEGVRATHRLVTDPALDEVSGRFFNGLREARADAQAYDTDARARLKSLSDELTSP
ncbi:SDR family NAD(P)-dependent oxidoreductase [Actinomadura madurae]|uniref:SDR family NAD(P)-dependent oxidoreductase n=1 Tax=Actinomadura madurae TaxID=1993 RepID=UPI0020D22227|nr:SDR family NAD(P)-dependent oxidoreductase [Actinomadura madurae]MCP9952244.1 SDR family NAD(P)-dependent oxidoreductase [Actinomadura madurae]MCP9969009.1 SDR family NAD(P)-dependent oxidoreductase [Actinomadura madurae]MCP9981477.1 SDR family NAD(P)-dependent oxidoreductase [Actinomadura madurae]MCQ0007008.1 SDR family NAD(P)-dependent oxidoreductase [Actinomadura madurae]MCQ0017682.1 SDR family NAD(P)-dependent oxidoreductase [Actinomadura madurae]